VWRKTLHRGDATELVEVEYEALPLSSTVSGDGTDARAARGHQRQDGRRAWPRKHPIHFQLASWRQQGRCGFDTAEVTTRICSSIIARIRRRSNLSCVASMDKIKGELTVWGTFQAPHVIRTVVSILSEIAEHKVHVIAPDIVRLRTRLAFIPATSVPSSPRSSRCPSEMGRGPDGKSIDDIFRS